jgi:hypothetical protein
MSTRWCAHGYDRLPAADLDAEKPITRGAQSRLEYQLVPWRPALEQRLGQHVAGTMTRSGAVDWRFGRKRGIGRLIMGWTSAGPFLGH